MTQKIGNFTIAILDKVTNKPVGTGFVVTDKFVITAYHVITSALHINSAEVISEHIIRVRFPSAKQEKNAFIVTKYSNRDYDIVTL